MLYLGKPSVEEYLFARGVNSHLMTAPGGWDGRRP